VTAPPLLQIQNLRTWFHTRAGLARAVDGVDLVVHPGKTLCLVGESGSGKSVTALSVLRLVDPPGRIEAGSRIEFEGRDVLTLDPAVLRRLRGGVVAMIFQEPMSSLNPVFPVGDQITEAIRTHRDVGAAEARERAVELLQLAGIPAPDKRLHDYPHQLSGGMRQRVMIAMALSGDPRLLIADEPTTALDVTIQAQILELLADLCERLRMAILLITHDLGVVAEMGDDVAVMYGGRVVEQGTVDDVLERPQHPYTEALLRSIPRVGMTYAERLRVIPGNVASPLLHPGGCRFAPRCEYAFERCGEDPPLFAVERQRSACWLCEHGPRNGGVHAES
jgi:oligopeptide/dipeptide ABC transporter ATP-binding protein